MRSGRRGGERKNNPAPSGSEYDGRLTGLVRGWSAAEWRTVVTVAVAPSGVCEAHIRRAATVGAIAPDQRFGAWGCLESGERIMKAVTTQPETRNCQQRLEDALTEGLNQESDIKISYRSGGNRIYTVNHNGRIWFCSEELKNRFWNAFGLDPDEDAQNNIAVEINPPLDGINLRIGAGIFAFDQDNSLFLLHSGRIGGGREGIGPRAFREWYHSLAPMRDVEIGEGKVKKGILVGNISDEVNFLGDLETFTRNVWVFKQLVTDQAIDSKSTALLSSLQTTKKKAGRPSKRTTSVSIYERDPRIAELVKLEAKGKCDLCNKKGPFMDEVIGFPFLETHHVKWLSKGGKDSIDNTVALCPNCHRKMHHVDDSDDIAKLRKIAKKREKVFH